MYKILHYILKLGVYINRFGYEVNGEMLKSDLEASRMSPKVSKGYKGLGMEGFIARWYAKNTQKVMEEYKTLARRVAENMAEGSSVLELAPGPGYLAIELAKLGNHKIVGLDISKTFVDIAQKKAKEAGVAIEFRQGDAASCHSTMKPSISLSVELPSKILRNRLGR